MGAVNGLVLIKPAYFSYTGTGGQMLNQGQMSFTSVSALTVDNIFSSEFDDYFIIMKFIANSSNAQWMNMNFRSGGVTNSSNKYSYQYTLSYYNTAPQYSRGVNVNTMYVGYMGSPGWTNMVKMHIHNPYLPSKTIVKSEHASDYVSSYNQGVYNSINTHNEAIVFDGIRLYHGNGQTFTGTINIYGMRK